VVDALHQQLAVTEALLVKILDKVGPFELTADELQKVEDEKLVIDIEPNDDETVWTIALKNPDE
jgi:hypothetical protein